MCGIYPSNNSGVRDILSSFFVGLVTDSKSVSAEDFRVVVELFGGGDPAFQRLGDRVLLVDDFHGDGCLGAMAGGE